MFRTKMVVLLSAVLAVAFGCVESTSQITQERSDKVAKYILKKAPKITHEVNAKLEDKVTMLGYNMQAKDPKPGSKVDITWYWQVQKDIGPGWRLFTHGIGNKEKLHNFDKPGKVRQNFQPEHWEAGMIIEDRQILKIPNNWKGDTLELRVGVWKGNDRLKGTGPKFDKNNRVKGPKIRLKQKPPKPPAMIPRAEKAPKIDGKFLEEEVWKTALKLDPFVNTMNGKPVSETTDVLLLWDEKNLYIAMSAQDDNLKSEYKKHDDELWHQDAFEIFLDPMADKKDYFEIQVSPLGTVFDSHLPKYRENKNEWISDMKVKVVTDGTVNNEEDEDKGWSAELAIPFAAMQSLGVTPPKPGEKWAVNFFRIDATKKKNLYSAWSPPMRGDFHTLEKFGQLIFKGDEAAEAAAAAGDETKGAEDAKKGAAEAKKGAEEAKKAGKADKAAAKAASKKGKKEPEEK